MSRRIGIATLAVAGVVAAVAQAPARADVAASLPSARCRFASVTDPSVSDGTQTGTVDAGPLPVTDDTNLTTLPSNFICTIQVRRATHWTPGDASVRTNDSARIDGPPTPAVIALPATQMSYTADVDDFVYLCSEVVIDGQHYYWDDDNTPTGETSHWSTNAQTARCSIAVTVSLPERDDPPLDTIGWVIVDAVVCPVLATIPPDGDIPGLWDCPPYDDAPRRA